MKEAQFENNNKTRSLIYSSSTSKIHCAANNISIIRSCILNAHTHVCFHCQLRTRLWRFHLKKHIFVYTIFIDGLKNGNSSSLRSNLVAAKNSIVIFVETGGIFIVFCESYRLFAINHFVYNIIRVNLSRCSPRDWKSAQDFFSSSNTGNTGFCFIPLKSW